MRRTGLAAVLAALCAAAAPAETPPGAGPRAGALEENVRALRAELIETAAAVQAHEEKIAAAAAERAALEARYRERRVAYEEDRARAARSLGALALLTRRAPDALIGRPADWADTVRGAVVLERVLPALGARADAAAAEAAALDGLRAGLAAAQAESRAARAVLAREQTRLGRLLARASSLQASRMAAPYARAAAIAGRAGRAGDVGALIDRIETARAASPPGGDATAPGAASVAPPPGSSLPWPAHGEVVGGFGDEAGGRPNPGISLATRAGAQVVAPGDGEVVFAGPFRRYGRLLIIDHGDDYHSLMAGFARIDARVGQRVLAGEPVGAMADGAGRATVLYVEVRRDRRPIDPVSWLMSNNRKVRG